MQMLVLGEPGLYRDGARVDLGPPRQLAVFVALLASAGRPVTKTEVAERVWGRDMPELAERNVAPYVYRLRRALRAAGSDGAAITSDCRGYVLAARPAEADLDLFRDSLARARAHQLRGDVHGAIDALDAGLGAWRGPALCGIPGPNAEGIRRRLENQRLLAIEQRFALAAHTADPAATVGDLAQAVVSYPDNENLTAMLVVALHRAGRSAEALEAYVGARSRLSAAGVEPGARLRGALAVVRGSCPASTPLPEVLPDLSSIPGRGVCA